MEPYVKLCLILLQVEVEWHAGNRTTPGSRGGSGTLTGMNMVGFVYPDPAHQCSSLL